MTMQAYTRLKRIFDILFCVALLPVVLAPMMLISLVIRVTSHGPVIYWSKRVGQANHIFNMPKFRTMRIDTPAVATHLMTDPDRYLTRVGKLLRKTSLDELPQLWSILKGDMSVVGPRPALFNQSDLIKQRTAMGVDQLLPGLTGWAQINGRDELDIVTKVELDSQYLARRSFSFDMKIIVLTLIRVLHSDDVTH